MNIIIAGLLIGASSIVVVKLVESTLSLFWKEK